MSDIDKHLEQLSPLQRALYGLKEIRKKYDALRQERSEPVAIIGMGCRFPGGANSLQNLWNLLSNRVCAVTETPPQRWNLNHWYDPDPDMPGRVNTRWGGFLDGIDEFDAAFFSITPNEALSMDPQQRLLLETAWHAFENANLPPQNLVRSRTGVFIGIMGLDYGLNIIQSGRPEDIDAYFGTGNTLGLAAGRLSYVFKLNGPSFSLDTACSSTLVALHLACQSLRNRECDLSVVGGVNLMMAPEITVSFSKAHLMAPDGRCKTFDAAADGYVRGEGCGVVILKRMSDAIHDHDRIHALIRGSAVNHDGPSGGLTVPSGPAQEMVIRQALNSAGLEPEAIDYIEAHGTGTKLGDPIEVGALAQVFAHNHSKEKPLFIGSIKTNFGHLEAAAGMASLFKVVLALKNKEIPAQLHFQTPNPKIDWQNIPIQVASEPVAWTAGDKPRTAGLSGFSFGGTNAHVIIAEAPDSDSSTDKTDLPISKVHILPVSARSNEALIQLAQQYHNFLEDRSSTMYADLCYTAAVGRSHFDHRLCFVAEDVTEARTLLQNAVDAKKADGLFSGKRSKMPRIVFMFSGQGTQYVNMGRELYDTQPIFRAAMDRCFDFIDKSELNSHFPKHLKNVIFRNDIPVSESAPSTLLPIIPQTQQTELDITLYTQPAIFILEFALAELWKSWGVIPDVLIGHSLGEYVAACVAQVFSVEDGLRLIVERARLMNTLEEEGLMVSVFAPQETVREVISPYMDKVSVAAVNGPEIILISGYTEAVEKVVAILEEKQIRTIRINISTAFHSPLTDLIMKQFQSVASEVNFSAPSLPLISNLTGDLVAGKEIATPDYWCRHMRHPVQFVRSMQFLHNNKYDTFLEIGPRPNLIDLDMTLPEGIGADIDETVFWLPSLKYGLSDTKQILESLAQLYVNGVSVDWGALFSSRGRTKIDLPNYPFQRKKFWINRSQQKQTVSTVSSQIQILQELTKRQMEILHSNARQRKK